MKAFKSFTVSDFGAAATLKLPFKSDKAASAGALVNRGKLLIYYAMAFADDWSKRSSFAGS